jgi:hypothetical protein
VPHDPDPRLAEIVVTTELPDTRYREYTLTIERVEQFIKGMEAAGWTLERTMDNVEPGRPVTTKKLGFRKPLVHAERIIEGTRKILCGTPTQGSTLIVGKAGISEDAITCSDCLAKMLKAGSVTGFQTVYWPEESTPLSR